MQLFYPQRALNQIIYLQGQDGFAVLKEDVPIHEALLALTLLSALFSIAEPKVILK